MGEAARYFPKRRYLNGWDVMAAMNVRRVNRLFVDDTAWHKLMCVTSSARSIASNARCRK